MGRVEDHEPAAITRHHPTGARVFPAYHTPLGQGTITAHPIDADPDGTRILPGRPMTAAAARGCCTPCWGSLHWPPEHLLAMGDASLA